MSSDFFKYAGTIAYDGTTFCGWQVQKTGKSGVEPSIQETIQAAIQEITGESPSVVSSGRTDSGVHAIGQVIHFALRNKEWDCEILRRGLNHKLRMKIQVLNLTRVAVDFHAQRSAQKKQYSYYFQQGPCPIPHLERFSWWIHKPLDLVAMNSALSHLVGEKDFKAFQASGSKPLKTTVRRILEAEAKWEPVVFPMAPEGVGFVRVRIIGTGFLKQMVRGIAGTLLQVGEGRRDPDCIREILQKNDRSLVGQTAPARALWLEKVWYK
ncbi:MAG: tRNA pseudouridine(38-40) synthase TruA [Bdellovibrionota bacterium]